GQLPDDEPFEEQAGGDGHGDARPDRGEVRPSPQGVEVPGHEPGQHADPAVGDVQHTGRPVDEDHPHGDERVDTAVLQADDDGLEELGHGVSAYSSISGPAIFLYSNLSPLRWIWAR